MATQLQDLDNRIATLEGQFSYLAERFEAALNDHIRFEADLRHIEDRLDQSRQAELSLRADWKLSIAVAAFAGALVLFIMALIATAG